MNIIKFCAPSVFEGAHFIYFFCFEGIERGSVVAVSTYMASEHGNRSDQKNWFMAGYNALLRRIEPEKIICYNMPFPEMQGDIVYVDYERSSWKYMSYERPCVREELESFKISGQSTNLYDTMSSFMDVPLVKGGGSAYGGQWRPNPNKPQDQRFLGPPGEIKTTYTGGYRIDTKIGQDGRAIIERHYTDHNRPWAHTSPHDHVIKWDNPAGFPQPQSPINYPDGAPDFKKYRGTCLMGNTIVPANTIEQNRFVSISDFKTCMRWNGEVEFTWKGITYNITHCDGKIFISHSRLQETERCFGTADEVLEYIVGGDRLRDVITQVTVQDRTI